MDNGANLYRKVFGLMAIYLFILAPFDVYGAMTSGSYQIQFDSIGVGGDNTSSSMSYQLRDSVGENAGFSTSTSYQVGAGYRAGIYDPVVAFTLFAQDRSSQVAATSNTSTSVTVTSSSGFTAGDMIALVQNEGASQISAMGRITSIAGNVLNVDVFHDAGVAPSADGASDYVYVMTDSSLNADFPTLGSSIFATTLVAWEVDADVVNGYGVYVMEDHDLQSASLDVIPDVADGAVTLGVSEYGARSSDTSLTASLFDSQDAGIATSPQQVGSRADVSFESRDFLTLKTSVAPSQPEGTYSHTLTLIFVGDY